MVLPLDGPDATEPEFIYHYTNPAGLIGILSDGELWATDVRYLNDSTELLHAERLHMEVLKELIAENPPKSLRTTLAKKAMGQRAFDYRRSTYVVCFCTEDDILSQWKTYGSWGSGFSIGFDRRMLASALPNLVRSYAADEILDPSVHTPDISLERVEYSEPKQKDYLRLAFDQYVSRLPTAPSAAEIQAFTGALSENVARSAARFKHQGFAAEKEWRIIISSHSLKCVEKSLCFRPSSRTVIPYRKTEKQLSGRLPVASVTIGPTLDQSLSVESVNALLDTKGYFNDSDPLVAITYSDIPLTRTD